MLSESRECIVPNEVKTAISTIDMNNQNKRFDSDEDEPHHIKLELEERDHPHKRRHIEPISESNLNLFACIIAAAITTFALVGLAIALLVLAFK